MNALSQSLLESSEELYCTEPLGVGENGLLRGSHSLTDDHRKSGFAVLCRALPVPYSVRTRSAQIEQVTISLIPQISLSLRLPLPGRFTSKQMMWRCLAPISLRKKGYPGYSSPAT